MWYNVCMTKRRHVYRNHWKRLIETYGDMCYWCNEEGVGCIDHITPVSYGGSDRFENLVPSCTLCNLLASDKVFLCEDSKRQYLVRRRRGRQRHYLCSCCGIPFVKNEHVPSYLMCPYCYDHEYEDTTYSESKRWRKWLNTMRRGGYDLEAYERIRTMYRKGRNFTMKERREIYAKLMLDNILRDI